MNKNSIISEIEMIIDNNISKTNNLFFNKIKRARKVKVKRHRKRHLNTGSLLRKRKGKPSCIKSSWRGFAREKKHR